MKRIRGRPTDASTPQDALGALHDAVARVDEVPPDQAPALKAITLPDLATLRATRGDTAGQLGPRTCMLAGRADPLDGGQGVYVWDQTSTATDNGTTIIEVAGVSTGRWRRLPFTPDAGSVTAAMLAPGVVTAPGLVLVSAITGTSFSWTGLTGDAADTLGYVIHFRMRAGGAATALGLRFNADTGNNYRHARNALSNAGANANDAGSDAASNIVLADNITTDDMVAGTITIPVSASGENRYVNAEVGIAPDATAGTTRGHMVRGRWTNSANAITQIDLIPGGGSFHANSRAALYRLAR